MSEERLNNFKRYNFVDADSAFHDANFTTLNAALNSYETISPCAPQKEVWSCVRMDNLRKCHIFHQRDPELWDSQDLPIPPPPQSIKCQESCFFFCRSCR